MFSPAFDLLDQGHLWHKLAQANSDRRLLWFIKQLHQNNMLQVGTGSTGALSEQICINQRVKQGYILEPFLFIYFY